jgi:uncharacterized alpha/beta hydrolase family protein
VAVNGALVSSSVKEANSDDEALEIAGDLLADKQTDAVEVWSSFRLVHRVVKDASHPLQLIDPSKLPRGSASV